MEIPLTLTEDQIYYKPISLKNYNFDSDEEETIQEPQVEPEKEEVDDVAHVDDDVDNIDTSQIEEPSQEQNPLEVPHLAPEGEPLQPIMPTAAPEQSLTNISEQLLAELTSQPPPADKEEPKNNDGVARGDDDDVVIPRGPVLFKNAVVKPQNALNENANLDSQSRKTWLGVGIGFLTGLLVGRNAQ